MRTKLWTLLLVVVGAVAACGSSDPEEAAATTAATAATTVAPSDAALTTVEDLTNDHIDPPATYPNSPSLGGDHYNFWHNCGFYELELLEGAATHSLEHGVVWITYNADVASAEDLAGLQSMAEDNDRLLISPYEHSEPLVLSAWGAQLRGVTTVADAQVADFIDTYLDKSTSPEPGAACSGAAGIPPNDVRTLANGDQVPPEWS